MISIFSFFGQPTFSILIKRPNQILANNLGSGFFVVKTAMPSPFSVKKWPHGCKVERKTASNFILTERLLVTKRPLKGLKIILLLSVVPFYLGLFGDQVFFGLSMPFGAFRPLSAEEKLGVVFFGHSALSFRSSINHRKNYSIDTNNNLNL